jgi:predicted RNase H-like nuclease (RuvC/YqgF family)
MKKFRQFINEDLEKVKIETAEKVIANQKPEKGDDKKPIEQKPDTEIIKNYENIIKNLETKKINIQNQIKKIMDILTKPDFSTEQKKELTNQKNELTKQIQEFDKKINSYKGDKLAQEEPVVKTLPTAIAPTQTVPVEKHKEY